MTLNVEKMRRAQARRTPDAVWKSIDVLDITEFEWKTQYNSFGAHFHQMMRLKHGKNLKGIIAYQSEMMDEPGTVRIQLVAELYK